MNFIFWQLASNIFKFSNSSRNFGAFLGLTWNSLNPEKSSGPSAKVSPKRQELKISRDFDTSITIALLMDSPTDMKLGKHRGFYRYFRWPFWFCMYVTKTPQCFFSSLRMLSSIVNLLDTPTYELQTHWASIELCHWQVSFQWVQSLFEVIFTSL